MNLLKDETISLKYLTTEEAVSPEIEVKNLINIQEAFDNRFQRTLDKLGLRQEEKYVRGDIQEQWDKFAAWKRDIAEYVLVETVEVILGTDLKVRVIYKPKDIK